MSVEKILAYGSIATGKTTQGLRIASWLKPKGAHLYCLDTDDTMSRSVRSDSPLLASNGGNLHIQFAYDWPDYVSWLEATLKVAVQNRDWLMVDRADKAWDRVQNWFCEEIYNMTLGERLAEVKKAMQSKGKQARAVSAFDQADWSTINANYNGWFLNLMYKSRCHIYLCASSGRIYNNDDENTRDTYAPFGHRPEGQKGMASECHTVFYFQREGSGERAKYLISTVKDRERPMFDRITLASLPLQYLKPNGYV
jgi:hypothetical protein